MTSSLTPTLSQRERGKDEILRFAQNDQRQEWVVVIQSRGVLQEAFKSSCHEEEESMAWVYLFVAGGFEIVWATGLKYSDGFTRLWPSVGTVAAMSVSMVCLALAARAIPIGTAYAIWTGIGAVGMAIVGIILFNEPRDVARLFFIFLIIAGIVGLKLATPS